ncbi:FtsX-like permease family protein [Vagococcus luciliae]|uniref:FtsX-like permease family protein n=1 Tax=Vagococcus luciliae TaxID=2920380 RepID=UPI00214EB304|nr:ABC transporter permease [Vagococcus luciliae]
MILFLVIFILGNLMAGAIAIQQATKGVETNIKTQLGANATVSFNQDKLQDLDDSSSQTLDMKEPTAKVYQEIGALKQVKFYDYSIIDMMQTKKIKNVEPSDGSYSRSYNGLYYFDIKGASRPELIDEQSKKVSLVDGRNFTEDDIKKGSAVAIISSKVAKENNLHVGDKAVFDRTIEHYNQGGSDDSNDVETKSKDYPVEIIGLFDVKEVEAKKSTGNSQKDSEKQMNQTVDLYDKLNAIYLPNNYIEKTQAEMLEFTYDNFPDNFLDENEKVMDKETVLKEFSYKNIVATYVLNKPEEIEDFRLLGDQILKDNGLNYYKIEASADQFDSIAGPIKGMAKISKIVLIVSILASIFIITLVTILFLRDRKHELGIYLSLGEKRQKIVGQIVVEVVLVALVAMTLSVFSGNLLAKGFSDSLMSTQQNNSIDNNMMMYGNPVVDVGITEDDVMSSYEIALTPSYIALFYLIGLIVVLLSTIVPLVYIMRLNPKKIMM